MIHFSERINPNEDVIIQQYADKCIKLYAFSLLVNFTGAIVCIYVVPIQLKLQPFVTLAEYPFDVNYEPLKTIIYLYQSTIGWFTAMQLCTNVFMPLLLWFVTARFDMLAQELRTTTNVYHLIKCIRKHQDLLR